MDKFAIMFGYMSDSDIADLKKVAGRPTLPELNSEIKEIIDVVAPVDAVTGNIENPVTKLLSGSVSVLEKERILSYMQKIPSTGRNDVSDADLAAILPSRYHSTLTDMDFVGMKIGEFIDGVNAAQTVDTPTDVDSSE